MKLINDSLEIIKNNWKVYKNLNYIFYGLIVIGMLAAKFIPSSFNPIDVNSENSVVSSFIEQFIGIGFFLAFWRIFTINLILGSLIGITLPSLVIPFSGFLVGVFRMFIWGIIFSPFTRELYFTPTSILGAFLIVLLILLEGQGYILALLGTYIHGSSFLFPEKNGLKNKKEGYIFGLKNMIYLYPLIAAVLLLAALLEAIMISAL